MKSPHRLTADKRVGSCRASPKLPSATSFIRRTLSEIGRKKVFIGGVYLKGSKTIISMEKFMVFLKISK